MIIIAALLSIGLQASPDVSLPTTPQGRQLDAFVKALRTSEAAFVTFQTEHMLPKRTPEQHKTMYQRIRKEFADFTILRVLSASADQVSVAVQHPAGMNVEVNQYWLPPDRLAAHELSCTPSRI